MLCESFFNLIPMEQRDYIGSLVHAVMNDESLFFGWEKTD